MSRPIAVVPLIAGLLLLTACYGTQQAQYYPADRKPSGYLAATIPTEPGPACFSQMIHDDYGRPVVACVTRMDRAIFVQ